MFKGRSVYRIGICIDDIGRWYPIIVHLMPDRDSGVEWTGQICESWHGALKQAENYIKELRNK